MCCPQPAQVGLPQSGHVTREHMVNLLVITGEASDLPVHYTPMGIFTRTLEACDIPPGVC